MFMDQYFQAYPLYLKESRVYVFPIWIFFT